MTQQPDWYTIADIDQLDSPALVIFPQRVKANIQRLVSMTGDVSRLRPHVKTHKTREATDLMLAAGITKFKCATIAEAEMLGQCNAPDVVLAYQPAGPKLIRYIEVILKYRNTRYTCLVDNIDAAREIAKLPASAGKSMWVYLDINVGQNRTGIAPEHTMDLYEFCTKTNGLSVAGLHAYDGHIRNKDFTERSLACNEAFAKVEALKKAIVEKGYPEPVIIAGGSPTFPFIAKEKMWNAARVLLFSGIKDMPISVPNNHSNRLLL